MPITRVLNLIFNGQPSTCALDRIGCAATALLLPMALPGSVAVDEVLHRGQPSYRIVTPTATWIYHREGAGMASLLDPNGRDWISYRPEGGSAGHYRGIPNAVFRPRQVGNNFFHPGHRGPQGSETTLVLHEPDRVLLRSRSVDGRWSGEWDIRPDRAHFRMTQLPLDDRGCWFLFEGTPGGRFDPTDLCLRADGSITPLSERWEADMRTVPWVAFISPPSGHALLLVAHEPPAAPVSYRQMEGAMTVFGFGRTHSTLDNLLTQPLAFTVALVADTDPGRLANVVREQLSVPGKSSKEPGSAGAKQ